MRLYIGRGNNYTLYKSRIDCKPQLLVTVVDTDILSNFCRFDFEKITGIKLAPGEIRKVKSIKIELEE